MCRLLDIQQENDQAGAEMLIESERFERIRGATPRAVHAFNLFQTPEDVAERMCAYIHYGYKTPRILEPSAGLGRLYKAVNKRFGNSANYHLVENNRDCLNELYAMDMNHDGHQNTFLYQRDFLQFDSCLKFDIIIMNPPFKMGTDIKHILHAQKFLAPGGILVALCYNGVKQNKQLKPISRTWEVLPEGSFKSEGTRASVAMLTIEN